MSEFPFACLDWEARIREGRSLLPANLPVNPAERQRAIGIFNKLRLPDVPGQPAMAEAAGDWFRDPASALLGSTSITGVRQIRELFLLTPKKQSKTTNGAALIMTALLMNIRPRAEFLLIGPTNLISDLAFEQAAGMVEADPDGYLQKRMYVRDHIKTIVDRRTKATLKIKTFDKSVLTGVKPAGVLIDELHEIAKNSQAGRIIGQIRGGLLPIPEAFLVFITTQSDEPPAGAFRAELTMARAIRDGRTTGPMLPVLYEFPEAIMRDEAQWQNPANWWMVTPNLGRSIALNRLVDEFETAKFKGEDELRRWASQHLNIEIGVALMTDAWEGAAFWEAAGDADLSLETLLKRADVAVVGIDGGGLDDLLGLTVIGRERETRRWLAWSKAWAHRCVLDRRKEIAPKLEDLQKEGTLAIVPDRSGDDVQEVADIVEQIQAAGLLPEQAAIGVDPVGITDIIDALADRDFDVSADAGRVVGISQGWKLSNVIKSTARRLAAGDLVHDGSRLMAWCVGNAKVEPRGNAVTITKQAAGKAKIDPLMALFNAASLMALNPSVGSVYQTEDLLIL